MALLCGIVSETKWPQHCVQSSVISDVANSRLVTIHLYTKDLFYTVFPERPLPLYTTS